MDCDVYESFTLPTNVLECIAHAIERLTVDHLEIMTLACAAMNFVIYIFWWSKPLNVNQSVRMFRKSEPPLEMQPRARELISEATWGGDRQRLGNNIDVDQEEDVDLSCDVCRYNYPPFDSILLADMDFNNTVLFFSPFVWRYTVYFISGGDLGFSVYVS